MTEVVADSLVDSSELSNTDFSAQFAINCARRYIDHILEDPQSRLTHEMMADPSTLRKSLEQLGFTPADLSEAVMRTRYHG